MPKTWKWCPNESVTHRHTNYWSKVCVQACSVPLHKCQVQYQWGTHTHKYTVEKTCKGAKHWRKGLGYRVLTPGKRFFSFFSVVSALTPERKTFPINLKIYYLLSLITRQCLQREYSRTIKHCDVHFTQADPSLSDTHSALMLLVCLTKCIVQIVNLANVHWPLCQTESASASKGHTWTQGRTAKFFSLPVIVKITLITFGIIQFGRKTPVVFPV